MTLLSGDQLRNCLYNVYFISLITYNFETLYYLELLFVPFQKSALLLHMVT